MLFYLGLLQNFLHIVVPTYVVPITILSKMIKKAWITSGQLIKISILTNRQFCITLKQFTNC